MTNDELRSLAECSGKGDIKGMEQILEHVTRKVEFHDYTLKSAVGQLISQQHYSILSKFAEYGFISTDLYDYDRFDTTIINILIKPPIVTPGHLESYLKWFESYLEQVDDVNEEIAGTTLLEYALRENTAISLLKTIVAAGADIHKIDQYGQTLLFKICTLRMQPTDRILGIVEWLLSEGIDPNAANVEQKTALHMAVDSVKPEVVISLLNAGADPNQKDWHGETAFYYAAVRQSNASLLEQLLNYGTPDFHSTNKQGENLLNAFLRTMRTDSEQNLKILSMLLEHGADFTEPSLWYQKEKTGVDWLIEKSATVLQDVISKGYLDVNYIDNEGNTLLHKVCQEQINYDENKARDLYKKVKFLVAEGIDPHVENENDKKAVDYAMEDNLKVKTVEWLLKQ
jgi:ankyrin repeat protein